MFKLLEHIYLVEMLNYYVTSHASTACYFALRQKKVHINYHKVLLYLITRSVSCFVLIILSGQTGLGLIPNQTKISSLSAI